MILIRSTIPNRDCNLFKWLHVPYRVLMKQAETEKATAMQSLYSPSSNILVELKHCFDKLRNKDTTEDK